MQQERARDYVDKWTSEPRTEQEYDKDKVEKT
jgi:hypothetical protein